MRAHPNEVVGHLNKKKFTTKLRMYYIFKSEQKLYTEMKQKKMTSGKEKRLAVEC